LTFFPWPLLRSLDDAAREVVNGRENMNRQLPGGRAGVYLFDQASKPAPRSVSLSTLRKKATPENQ
jgi:hypothetical protein